MSQSIEGLLRSSRAIISLQGREYVTFRGLLYVAHQAGLESIDVELVSWDPEERAAVVKATVKGERGSFADYGDANPSNVNRMIASACLRMASTRAQGRALRSYLGVGITSVEELPGGPVASPEPAEEAPAPAPDLDYEAAARWGVRVGAFENHKDALAEVKLVAGDKSKSMDERRALWRARCAELKK